MAARYLVLAALCAASSAAPPAPPRLYTQHAPAHLQQQINPYDYYLENQEAANYYHQAQQKQANSGNGQNGAPSRLESLEPDSEVELIPGAQQPQQPPQQTPVSPNIPGLIPGQRVFIVHMPVPGYRPGSIGGYQPVYIVAAAPQGIVQYPGNAPYPSNAQYPGQVNGSIGGYQPVYIVAAAPQGIVQYPGNAPYPGNAQYPGQVNGYQNAVLLDTSGQAVISPLLGYPRLGVQQHPGFVLAPQLQSLKGYDLGYQEPASPYQQVHQAGQQSGTRPVQLSQLITLQTHAANAANNPRTASNESAQNVEPKRLAQSRESNDKDEDRRASSHPAHAAIKP